MDAQSLSLQMSSASVVMPFQSHILSQNPTGWGPNNPLHTRSSKAERQPPSQQFSLKGGVGDRVKMTQNRQAWGGFLRRSCMKILCSPSIEHITA